ncbi:MAG: hypothetical protein ACE5JB_02530 [bacterium]
MKRSNKILGDILCLVIILFVFLETGFSQNKTLNSNEKFSINLKTKALVLGPKIRLGDIGKVIVPDSLKKLQLASIILGEAPPPGESSELSLSYIKRCVKRAGFGEYISYIKGPRIIRITTAQIEIDKVLLKEELAYSNNSNLSCRKAKYINYLEFFYIFAYNKKDSPNIQIT